MTMVVRLNPMTPVLDEMREGLLGTGTFDMARPGYAVLAAVAGTGAGPGVMSPT